MTRYRNTNDWVRWALGITVPSVLAYMAWTTNTLISIKSDTAASEAVRRTTSVTLKEEIGRLRGQLSDFRSLLDGLYRTDAANNRAKEVDSKFERIDERLRVLEVR